MVIYEDKGFVSIFRGCDQIQRRAFYTIYSEDVTTYEDADFKMIFLGDVSIYEDVNVLEFIEEPQSLGIYKNFCWGSDPI